MSTGHDQTHQDQAHHGHAHHHGHSHVTARGDPHPGTRSRLAWTFALVVAYMIAEVVGGLLSHSLALLADAGHMFSDAAALALAWFALWFARQPASSQHTFGYYRTEILAALANGVALIAVAIYILVEAVQRISDPPEVQAGLMMAVAAGGLVVNVAGLWLLHGARSHSLNVRGAWLHVLSDLLGSVQALIAGGLIWLYGWHWADPVASIVIALLIAHSSWALLRDCVSILMQRAPSHINVEEVRGAISEMEGVIGLCDLHVWTLTSGMESLSAHVIVDEGLDGVSMLRAVRERISERFGIDHMTVQLEPPDFDEADAGF